VVLEALALGRPVIATHVAAIPEILDDGCGWLVPAGDVEALSSAMVKALRADTSDLSEMGRIGRRRVEERHDIRNSAMQLSKLFFDNQKARGADSRSGRPIGG
jgi:glycosyltransferase involved in cell wall biosynthesis